MNAHDSDEFVTASAGRGEVRNGGRAHLGKAGIPGTIEGAFASHEPPLQGQEGATTDAGASIDGPASGTFPGVPAALHDHPKMADAVRMPRERAA